VTSAKLKRLVSPQLHPLIWVIVKVTILIVLLIGALFFYQMYSLNRLYKDWAKQPADLFTPISGLSPTLPKSAHFLRRLEYKMNTASNDRVFDAVSSEIERKCDVGFASMRKASYSRCDVTPGWEPHFRRGVESHCEIGTPAFLTLFETKEFNNSLPPVDAEAQTKIIQKLQCEWQQGDQIALLRLMQMSLTMKVEPIQGRASSSSVLDICIPTVATFKLLQKDNIVGLCAALISENNQSKALRDLYFEDLWREFYQRFGDWKTAEEKSDCNDEIGVRAVNNNCGITAIWMLALLLHGQGDLELTDAQLHSANSLIEKRYGKSFLAVLSEIKDAPTMDD
jgi:hypothetical protein